MNNYFAFLIILVLLIVEIILHLGDGAILAASMAKLYSKYKNSSQRDELLEIKKNATKIASVIIMINNITHQIVTIQCTVFFLHVCGSKGMAYMTLALGIFYAYLETFLKITSVEFPESIMYYLGSTLKLMYRVFAPMSHVIDKIVFWQLKIFGIKQKSLQDPVEEIQGAIGYHLDKIDQDHAHILKNAANLSNWSVLEIMTHRQNLVTLCIDENIQSLINVIKTTSQEYIPIWQSTEENIIGFVSSNLLLKTIVLENFNDNSENGKKLRNINDYMQKPTFIYKKMTISKFLHLLSKDTGLSQSLPHPYLDPTIHKQDQVFFVVEEDGSFLGIVNRDSLADAIIKNTSCSDITNIRKYKEGYIVQGGTTINNVNLVLGFDLDPYYITITNLFLNNYKTSSAQKNYINLGKYKIILLSKPTTNKMMFYIEKIPSPTN